MAAENSRADAKPEGEIHFHRFPCRCGRIFIFFKDAVGASPEQVRLYTRVYANAFKNAGLYFLPKKPDRCRRCGGAIQIRDNAPSLTFRRGELI
jgi:hypothetical protein